MTSTSGQAGVSGIERRNGIAVLGSSIESKNPVHGPESKFVLAVAPPNQQHEFTPTAVCKQAKTHYGAATNGSAIVSHSW